MLLIKATPKASAIHGIGLFADQDIAKGARIWKFSPGLDTEISPTDFEKLDQREKDFILFYGFNSRKTGNYHISFDNVRFINHAKDGNVSTDTSFEDVEYPLVANRDIKQGEEITQNYFEFDDNHAF
ncbi:MAG TPA: SET domain-containing protein [Candidatus Paceibacterota bacterium]